MHSAQLILLFTLQMQGFGIFFQTRLARKFVSHLTSASRKTSFGDARMAAGLSIYFKKIRTNLRV